MPKIRIALFTAAALIAAAAPGPATTMVYLSLEDLDGLSDEVLIGRVLEVEPYLERDGATIYTAVTLEVLEPIKGETQPRDRITLHHIGGEVDGLALRYAGMPSFRPESQVAVFLKRLGREAFAIVGMCQGVLQVEERDGTWFAVRNTGSMRFVDPRFPGRGPVMEPHQDESYTLPELRSRIGPADRRPRVPR